MRLFVACTLTLFMHSAQALDTKGGSTSPENISRQQIRIDQRIFGEGSLGTPDKGYRNNPDRSAILIQSVIESGRNASKDGNDGRTSFSQIYQNVLQRGSGDALGVLFSCTVSGLKADTTSFLANPACGWANAQVTAAVEGAYLNVLELGLKDDGYDVSGIGAVINMRRTNETAQKGATWIGTRIQSIGSKAVDSGLSLGGLGGYKIGLDLSALVSPKKAAMAMGSGARIYGNSRNDSGSHFSNATILGSEWIGYAGGGWEIVVEGRPKLKVSDRGVGFNGSPAEAPIKLPDSLPSDGSASNEQITNSLNAIRAALIAAGLAR